MADEVTSPEIQINIKGPSELKLQIAISLDKTVIELKQAIAAKSSVEADRQRLIYSGRVLKDDDLLSVYKIQTGHTVHMVKGASRPSASSSPNSTSTSTSHSTTQTLPTNLQAGQNPHDPLTQLNSSRTFGDPAFANFNPFTDMGLNPNDPNMMQNMMNDPNFLQQMSSMMANPEVIEQVIAMNPALAAMGPQVRETFRSEGFRNMISNPESLRQMMQMSQMLQGGGGGAFGAPPAAFPAPGIPGSTPATTTPGTTTTPPQQQQQPGVNPMFNPALMQQFFAGAGAGGAGGQGAFNPWAAFGAPPAAATTPAAPLAPPEERFQVQLQQLQDMGFTNAQQNVRALLATGGNVHSAIEYILGGGGL